MEHIFIDLLNISITAGYMVLAILLLRPLLSKAPKFVRCLLWALVGLRLAFPFSIESILSLIPSAETVPQEILYSSQPAIHSGIAFMNSAINPVLSGSLAPTPGDSVNPMQVVMAVAANIWILGMIVMAVYAAISYFRLRHKLNEAVHEGNHIWLCDHIGSAFLLGLFRPRIYLPSALAEQDKPYVIAHEKAHLQRRDHWWKPLGYLLLTVYWFNPLMWVAYIFLCRDIEFACDEKVIRQLGTDCKRSYSEALINCSVSKKSISACPVAFGEEGVKSRIQSILNYKKPAFWIILIAIIVCIAVAVCFLTVPQSDAQLYGARYETGRCLFSSVVSADKETESNNLVFDIHGNEILFGGEVYKEYESGEREYLDILCPWTYTEDELNNTLLEQGDSPISLHPIQDSYAVFREGTLNYVFLTHTNGKVTLVSFFSDGNIMSIFELAKLDACTQVNSSHNSYLEAYITQIEPESGYIIATVTDPNSALHTQSVKVLSYPNNAALGEKISIIYDGSIVATETHPLTIQNVYSMQSLLSYDYSFLGVVLGIQDDAVLVEPAMGEAARELADQFVVRSGNPDAYQPGDEVYVHYDLTAELDPPIIPYPCTIVKANNSSALFDPSTVPASGQIVYDIDSDGIVEHCFVTEHYYRIHTLAVYTYENGVMDRLGYFFPGDASGFSFRKNDDGTLSILSAKPERIFSLTVQGSRLIVTDENNEHLLSWGEDSDEVATLQNVINKYPQFLNLTTDKGLEVYVWKNGDWRCGVRSGTNRNATTEELLAFRDGATLEEMAVILSTYPVTMEEISILYNYHPAFSGPYEVVPSDGEQAYIEKILFQFMHYWAAPKEYPDRIIPQEDLEYFEERLQYLTGNYYFAATEHHPLVIYAFQLAEKAWCFQFVEDTSIARTTLQLMNYPHCNLEKALEKLEGYNIPSEKIPVVVYQNPISSYIGTDTLEEKTQTARDLLGLG